jgi:hypothetical protein
MLPAVPCVAPSLTWSERVGHGPGPAGAGDEVLGAAAGESAGDAALVRDDAAGATVLPLAVVLEELPQAAARAATQVNAAAVTARRATRGVGSITVSSVSWPALRAV